MPHPERTRHQCTCKSAHASDISTARYLLLEPRMDCARSSCKYYPGRFNKIKPCQFIVGAPVYCDSSSGNCPKGRRDTRTDAANMIPMRLRLVMMKRVWLNRRAVQFSTACYACFEDWIFSLNQVLTSFSERTLFDFAILVSSGTISSSIATRWHRFLSSMSKAASGRSSQYSPISCASENSTSASIDLDTGNDLTLFFLIFSSFFVCHITSAKDQRLLRLLVYK